MRAGPRHPPRILKKRRDDGRASVTLNVDRRAELHSVPRLVAEAFLGKPEIDDAIVIHVDGDRTNDRPDNLAWITRAERARGQRRQQGPRRVEAAPTDIEARLKAAFPEAHGVRVVEGFPRVFDPAIIRETHPDVGRALPVPNHPGYFATEAGEIVSMRAWPRDPPRILKKHVQGGRACVTLIVDGKLERHLVPRLVAESFLGKPEKGDAFAIHVDGDRANDRPDNLAWISKAERREELRRRQSRRRAEAVPKNLATRVKASFPDAEDVRVVEGFPNYAVDAQGFVYSLFSRRAPRRPRRLSRKGMITLAREGEEGGETHSLMRSHLVARAFLGPPPARGTPCVVHLDGDRTNSAASNLQWSTLGERLNARAKRAPSKTRREENEEPSSHTSLLSVVKRAFPALRDVLPLPGYPKDFVTDRGTIVTTRAWPKRPPYVLKPSRDGCITLLSANGELVRRRAPEVVAEARGHSHPT